MTDEVYDLTCPSTFECWICDTINLRQPNREFNEFRPMPTWDHILGSSIPEEEIKIKDIEDLKG